MIDDATLAPLGRYAPEVLEALEASLASVAETLPSDLVEELEGCVQRTLGIRAGAPGERTPLSDLVEQYVVYVPGVGDDHRERAAEALASRDLSLRTFVEALYAVDQACRQRLAHAQLFEPDGGPLPRRRVAQPAVRPLDAAVRGLHAAAMRLPEIDPVTTELVRLRCAHHHDCHL